jgi:primosomal protein N' (replication factor Y)
MKVMITSKDYRKVVKEAQSVRDSLILQNMEKVVVLGPSPASIPKINDLYRYQIIVKYKDGKELNVIAKEIIENYESNRYVNVDFDNNPLRLF